MDKFDLWWEEKRGKLYCGDKEREREAYTAGMQAAAEIVEKEGQDYCSCVDGEKCESCRTVDDILQNISRTCGKSD